jgi:hypothetical protein
MAPLNDAVQTIVNEKQSPAETLQSVAEKWNELTKTQELNKFRREYQRSVGNDS